MVMSNELPKTYNPTAVQNEVARVWEEEKCFHAEPKDPGEPYSVVIPPPNVTAALHLGHALNNTLQDILVRRARMQGKNAVWLPGTDHAGIATQTVVEKRVLKEEGKRRTDFARDEFVRKIQAWKDEYEQVILGQLKAMGCSCDWDRTAFTMDAPRAKAVREAFFQLFQEGLIYRGKRLVNWDPVTQTALADDEVENEEVDGFFYYLKYPLADGSGTITVATTRPETMLGDTAVAINPKDPRASSLKGKQVRLPIVGRLIPIIEDEYVVLPVSLGGDPEDPKAQMATGFLKVTPAHDPNDYDIGLRHHLPVINVMAPDASISDQYGWTDIGEGQFLLGLSREQARKKIVQWFKEHGLLEDQKPYRHSVGHSYRSHVPIEPYLSDQWYCRVTDKRLSGAALKALNPSSDRPTEGTLTFYPERYAKTYQTWHENIRDWCISRQLWWGHRIPVWSCERPTPQAQTWVENQSSEQIATLRASDTLYVCVRREDASGQELVRQLESFGFVQDPDVLDTWFSSGLWPLSTLGWPEQTPELEKWNPTAVLCTAREIITLWVSRMVMFNLFFKGRIPFRDVFIHAMIQDGEGRKMSKTLGNGVDPLDIIASHGTDALRFTLASMATNTQDVRMPVEKDPVTGKNTSPKFDLGRHFANKLWNAARFVIGQIEGIEEISQPSVTVPDRWIMSRFNRTVVECDEALLNYRFDQYAKACYDFFWRDFCDWYVEVAKVQLKHPSTRASTARVIVSVLDAILRLMHPIVPFVTEKLWWKLNEVCPNRGIEGWIKPGSSKRLIRARWPEPQQTDESAENVFAKVQELIVSVRTVRSDYKVNPRQTVDVMMITPNDLKSSLQNHQEVIESLATCRLIGVQERFDTPPNDAVKVQVGRTDVYVLGLVNADAEKERIAKRREELTRSIAALRGRLNNAGYLSKAPAHLVKQTQDQLASAEAELRALSS